jgi:hypothetical protein
LIHGCRVGLYLVDIHPQAFNLVKISFPRRGPSDDTGEKNERIPILILRSAMTIYILKPFTAVLDPQVIRCAPKLGLEGRRLK